MQQKKRATLLEDRRRRGRQYDCTSNFRAAEPDGWMNQIDFDFDIADQPGDDEPQPETGPNALTNIHGLLVSDNDLPENMR
jgi:hypothetical protein